MRIRGIKALVVTCAMVAGGAAIPVNALADGAMAVDCDTATAGIQASCTGAQHKTSGGNFDIYVNATAAPATPYAGFDATLTWNSGSLSYVPSAGETSGPWGGWPSCVYAASDSQPSVPSLFYGCASSGGTSTYTGTLLRLTFKCDTDGTTPITFVSGAGASDFVALDLSSILPALLQSATVQCGVPPPNPPTFGSTTPASPSSNNNPKVIGTADAGTTVKLYTNSSCSGSPIVPVATAAAFASPGITVSVGDNTMATYYGTATNASSVTSACSGTVGGGAFPNSITYVEDSAPPDTSIDSGPSGTIQTTSATFGFSSEPGATFECRLDGGSFASCTSTKQYNALSDGSHTFEVRATDTAGNVDATPASRTFTVLTTPATLAVTTTNDELNSDGDCSLREAISAANTDSPVDACPAGSGHDTIIVPAGTYPLGIAGAGEDANATGDLDITADLTLNGAGALSTVVDGGGLDRVFHVDPGHNNITVDINGFTARNGAAGTGGGINNAGTTLTLNNSTVSGNTTSGAGGGLYNGATGVLTLNNSTVSGNTAAAGGGIGSQGALTINDSTVSANTATIFPGGGVYVAGGTADLNNATIASNSGVGGGGIYNAFGTATLKNTLIADNASNDCWALLNSAGHNLIENTATCSIGGDLTGNVTGLDPMLGPLQNNGGSTKTHDLLTGSPAIGAGSGGCPPPGADQRGIPKPQGSTCDIGAVEACDAATDRDSDGLSDCQEILQYHTDYLNPDTDKDGCKDGAEINNPPNLGGSRDPLNFWDFFDVPLAPSYAKDKTITVSDILAVVQRYNGNGDPGIDPLSTPGPAPAYHTAFDRTPLGPNVWNLGPPNGHVRIDDILAVIKQYSHDCS